MDVEPERWGGLGAIGALTRQNVAILVSFWLQE